jgi:hypothetical protein
MFAISKLFKNVKYFSTNDTIDLIDYENDNLYKTDPKKYLEKYEKYLNELESKGVKNNLSFYWTVYIMLCVSI